MDKSCPAACSSSSRPSSVDSGGDSGEGRTLRPGFWLVVHRGQRRTPCPPPAAPPPPPLLASRPPTGRRERRVPCRGQGPGPAVQESAPPVCRAGPGKGPTHAAFRAGFNDSVTMGRLLRPPLPSWAQLLAAASVRVGLPYSPPPPPAAGVAGPPDPCVGRGTQQPGPLVTPLAAPAAPAPPPGLVRGGCWTPLRL